MRRSSSAFSLFTFGACVLSAGILMYGCGGSSDESQFGNGNGNGNGSNGNLFGGDGGGGNNVGDFQDASSLLEAGCAQATARAARQPVYMLIVLDGSGSMKQENKWVAVVPALDAFFDDLKGQGDTTIGVGLTVFSDQKDKTNGKGPYPVIEVPIAVVDAAQSTSLHKRIDTTGPSGSTPTYAALQGQYPQLEAFTPVAPLAEGGKRVLVFMTDGVPNPADQEDESVALVKQETQKGVLLFAVGIGDLNPLDTTSYNPVFMAQLAEAGGTAKAGCDVNEVKDETKMCHFQITPGGKTAQQLEQSFRDAIDQIRGAVASCEFTLDKSGGGGQDVDPSKVNVVYDDGNGGSGVIPEDGTNGWTYDDPANPSKVILHGSSCDTLKGNPNGGIKIVLGCRSITK